ncbi:DNA cytosine methyltransferase [Patescibacteria group bacterium]|nr:DNA cytosine methyltransferase [Patescibacteria group bacterium]
MAKIQAVDFFCSGGGMTCGLRQAGINVIAGIDSDPTCQDTYEKNNPGSRFILADVFKLKEKDLQKKIGIKKNDKNLILIGCSPCQFWSVIRTDKKKSEKSKNLLIEFKRFVDYFKPGYVLVENVPGILSNRKKSGLDKFVLSLEEKGYAVHCEIVNMSDYGVPQSRKRFSLIATRVSKNKISLKKKVAKKRLVKDVIGVENGFARVKPGHKDKTFFNHSVAGLSEKNLNRLKQTPKNGGSWLDWAKNKNLKRKTYRGEGFKDNYGRMSWNKPAPTITTRFFSISNGRFAHPVENRAISLREGATLQTFPKKYVFYSNTTENVARMIGNAVPPLFAKQLGQVILNSEK